MSPCNDHEVRIETDQDAWRGGYVITAAHPPRVYGGSGNVQLLAKSGRTTIGDLSSSTAEDFGASHSHLDLGHGIDDVGPRGRIRGQTGVACGEVTQGTWKPTHPVLLRSIHTAT